MKTNVRLALEFFAGLVVSIIITIQLGIDSGFGTFISLVGGIATVCIFETKQAKKKAAARTYMTYDKETNTLTLNARKQENANVIKIEEMVDYNLNYHPSKIVYTGATVGGVHTGGFHDAGNYYTMDGTSTKKYHLIYNGVGVTDEDYCPIRTIKLGASLIEEAKKNSVISQYLNQDGTLNLSNPVKSKYAEHMGTAMERGNVDLAMQMAKADYYNQQLTKGQCNAIRNWICSLESH